MVYQEKLIIKNQKKELIWIYRILIEVINIKE